MIKAQLGIVGLGYVGTAVYEGLKDHHNVNTFDVAKELSLIHISEPTRRS